MKIFQILMVENREIVNLSEEFSTEFFDFFILSPKIFKIYYFRMRFSAVRRLAVTTSIRSGVERGELKDSIHLSSGVFGPCNFPLFFLTKRSSCNLIFQGTFTNQAVKGMASIERMPNELDCYKEWYSSYAFVPRWFRRFNESWWKWIPGTPSKNLQIWKSYE